MARKAVRMKFVGCFCIFMCLFGIFSSALAVELENYRLLSVSSSEKLILVSQIPGKKKYLLDASSAKITINGKPAEIKELVAFSIIQVKLELARKSRNGIALDGLAKEIRVVSSDQVQ